MEQELKDTAGKCESLEEQNKAQAAELAKGLQEAKEARTESRAAREEIKQVLPLEHALVFPSRGKGDAAK